MARKTTSEETPDTDGLTLKQRRFVHFYLAVTNGNATQAARLAGYAGDDVTLASVGYENLRKPQISALIERLMEEEAMPAREVLQRLTRHARASIADVFEVQGDSKYPVLNIAKAFETGGIHTIKSIKRDKGALTIETVDVQNAIVQLGRYHKLFTDKSEVSGAVSLIREYPEGV